LPSQLCIRLNLGTHRRSGKPALDIVAVPEEGLVNVCQASGGSLMNVLSTGLRISAVVKSGLRPFAAFDESECWLAPENVPVYANVLVRLADELDVQCLLISHHDPKMFRGGFVVRLDGTPETGLTTIPESPVPPEDAHATSEAFAWIRLVNFRSHVDTRIPLAPGLTCLVGGNNISKSAVLGAFGALADGDIKDSDIRHGARGDHRDRPGRWPRRPRHALGAQERQGALGTALGVGWGPDQRRQRRAGIPDKHLQNGQHRRLQCKRRLLTTL
jgi:hypothetical protein